MEGGNFMTVPLLRVLLLLLGLFEMGQGLGLIFFDREMWFLFTTSTSYTWAVAGVLSGLLLVYLGLKAEIVD